jgi:ABC-type phosphate transport system substrate-binding protein
MKRMTRWSDGRAAVPVEPADAKLRERFGARVHGRKLAQIDAYWDHQVFTGREVPPGRKATDEEIIAFVRRTPGAIGYVAAGTTVPDGVKLVSVH